MWRAKRATPRATAFLRVPCGGRKKMERGGPRQGGVAGTWFSLPFRKVKRCRRGGDGHSALPRDALTYNRQ